MCNEAFGGPQKDRLVWSCLLGLTAEPVQGLALSLERVDYVHGCHGLSLGMLGVRDRIPDHVLKEILEDTSCLFVDETTDALDTASAGKASDSGLGDTLDVITKDLSMPLRATLTKPLSSFTTSRHCFS
jgi:hypothetical protein